VSTSAQLLVPQTFSLAVQAPVQVPAEQKSPPVHTVPHAPQLLPSDNGFTQASPQALRPPVHWQTPAEQLWPAPHTLPQAPQLALSALTSMQRAMHTTSAPGQPVLDLPALPPLPPVPLPP
jgi:hypothetical protein